MRGHEIDGEPYYAHTLPGAPRQKWHVLDDHLKSVAETAAGFAAAFGARSWGYAAGLWHDVGKYAPAFRSYLLRSAGEDYHRAESEGKVDHTSAGAQFAVERIGIPGHLLAYAIAGHHAGLLDGIAEGASLDKRLKKKIDHWRHGLARIPDMPELPFPVFLREALNRRGSDPKGTAFSLRGRRLKPGGSTNCQERDSHPPRAYKVGAPRNGWSLAQALPICLNECTSGLRAAIMSAASALRWILWMHGSPPTRARMQIPK